MPTKVHAVFRDGVFRPSTPPPVAEGAEVELIITTEEAAPNLADALADTARLPEEGPIDGFSGADHDQILNESIKQALTFDHHFSEFESVQVLPSS